MESKKLKSLCLLLFLLMQTAASFARDPRLPEGYFWKKLPNGLQVVVIENHKVPLTTIEIAVKNGAYTEGPEYSGLSHLFEHMFFKANKDYSTQEKFLKRTQELGAIWNGTTDVERVNYFFTFERRFEIYERSHPFSDLPGRRYEKRTAGCGWRVSAGRKRP